MEKSIFHYLRKVNKIERQRQEKVWLDSVAGPTVAKASQAAVVEKRRRKKKRGDSEASRILLVQDVVNIVQCANCGVKGISCEFVQIF